VGLINREVIEEVRTATNIVDVVGSHVSLRKRGKNYTGLCPFHAEKAPSFTVSNEKQIFHCFGCGASGSVFDFLMRMRNLDFAEAVRELAGRSGIALPQRQETKQAKRLRELADSLRQANEIAASYFSRTLTEKGSGEKAREYLRSRGISKEAIRDFQLGYAPQSWDGLKRFLLSKKVDMEVAVQAGLLVKKSGGDSYDRFRHRLIFPIKDMRGLTVGFGGRALDEESLPKYLNSPETPIFHKGRILYGLATARDACRQHEEALVVEGYFDLLALYSQGIHQVVAPLGTALTLNHIRLLSRLAPAAVLVFDGDEAGMKAAMRSLELFLRENLPVRILTLPAGMDPDDFLTEEGKDSFLQLLKDARPLLEVFLEQSLSSYDGSVEARLKVVRTATPMLRLLDSRVTQEAYLRMLSQRLDVSEEVLLEELDWQRTTTGTAKIQYHRVLDAKVASMEEVVVRILVHYPQWIELLVEDQVLDNFKNTGLHQVARLLLKYSSETGNVDWGRLLLELEDDGLRKMVSGWSLEASPWSEDVAQLRLREYLEGIKSGKSSRAEELTRLQQEIQAAEQSQNESLLEELLLRKAALLTGKANDKANLSKGEMV
jgi:DNA primase